MNEVVCIWIARHVERFGITPFSCLQLCYFANLFIGNVVWNTCYSTRSPWVLGKSTGRADIMTIIIAACTRVWRNHESTFYKLRSHWWWSVHIASGGFLAMCFQQNAHLFANDVERTISLDSVHLKLFRYSRNFETILICPCERNRAYLRAFPNQNPQNKLWSILVGIVTRWRAFESEVCRTWLTSVIRKKKLIPSTRKLQFTKWMGHFCNYFKTPILWDNFVLEKGFQRWQSARLHGITSKKIEILNFRRESLRSHLIMLGLTCT